jgi:hypothetical protein
MLRIEDCCFHATRKVGFVVLDVQIVLVGESI